MKEKVGESTSCVTLVGVCNGNMKCFAFFLSDCSRMMMEVVMMMT
jgi:hypothetical protein